jgi:transglutaminase-like putative cysteine protease/predicted glutamine amidotransferase
MPNYLGMSFEGELAPSFDLRCLRPGRKPPDGWGIGFYPGDGPSSTILKEPAPPFGSIRSELVKAWEHLESSLFLLHIRVATWGGVSAANTQPFGRSWGGRDWMLAHAGSLAHKLPLRTAPRFEPVGTTDTEMVLCELMGRVAEAGWRTIGDADPRVLHSWFDELNAHGSLSTLFTDGRDLVVYSDRDGSQGKVYFWELMPPYTSLSFGDEDLEVDLTRRGIKSRKGIIVCSAPVAVSGVDGVVWRLLPPGHLLVVRQGAVRAEVWPANSPGPVVALSPSRAIGEHARPQAVESKKLSVSHRTVYTYEKPVGRSTHLLRLVPYHDHYQSLLSHQLSITVDGEPLVQGERRGYEDVFGNRARRVLIERPYSELAIEAKSTVEVLDTDPLGYRPIHDRSTIPLVWMPWQRQILQPFLLPPELAESELQELTDYAMSFAKRNDFDLLETLLDVNGSIYREYEYKQASTSVLTTAFDVYANRRGVCQDFTNLFICLARLLGVPARYVCGYIYTGPKNPNQRQSEASHAWLQVYLPEVGWKGFDPTNGILTQADHVRVAVGRNYIDATPTSGTLYVGGGTETLEVIVRVEEIVEE